MAISVDSSKQSDSAEDAAWENELVGHEMTSFTRRAAHPHGWEKKMRGLFSRGAGEIGIGGNDRGLFSRDTLQHFTPQVGCLSVTAAAP